MELGRITPSWRQIFHDTVFQLRTRHHCFYNTLRDPRYQVAFDHLIKAWSFEDAAMGNAGIPIIMDIMHLMASIHIRRCIEELKMQLDKLDPSHESVTRRL